jgi:nucleosome binding factor SPN SPT16 subunit
MDEGMYHYTVFMEQEETEDDRRRHQILSKTMKYFLDACGSSGVMEKSTCKFTEEE